MSLSLNVDRHRTPAAGARPQTGFADTLESSVRVISVGVWLAELTLATLHSLIFADRFGGLDIFIARTLLTVFAIMLCLGMHRILRRWTESRPWRLLGRALVLSVPASAVLVMAAMALVRAFTGYYEQFPDHWTDVSLMAWNFLTYFWMLCAWSALYVGAAAVLQMREREAQLAAARSTAQQAQLQALRMQINPHFLFNALNTLSGLMALGRARESERIVLDLSRRLRHTLSRTPCDLVPLAEEMAMVQRYLDIETARFPDRLQVRYALPPDCGRALLPALILLPLAENSVKYALAGAEDGIAISIGACRCGDYLLLWLEDERVDPATPPAPADRGLGIGLSNLHQQLAALYGDGARLESGPAGHGWRNLVIVPWREGNH